MLTLLILIPLAAIVLIAFKAPPKETALAAVGADFLLTLAILARAVPGAPGFQFEQIVPWVSVPGFPAIHYHVGIDGLNLPLLFLTTIVAFTAVAVSPRDVPRAAEFYSYVLAIAVGAVGAFLSIDLFFFWVFHELALIPTFLLIGIWGTHNRQFAALQITLYLGLGSLVLLAGLIALVAALPEEARSFDLPVIQAAIQQAAVSGHAQGVIYGLLLVGFGTLVSLVPFHTWAPAGYASAPTAVSMLHGGVLKKFALYGLLRVALPLLPLGAAQWQGVLIALLLANILYIGLVAVAQKELKMMLAYGSVMHMGYLFLGLVAWNALSLGGVVVLMVAHGLSTALLFALAGEVQARTGGEVRMAELGGLAKRMPFIAVTFILGAMAAAGLPGLGNFAGEVLIFFGAWKAHPVVTALVFWGSVLTPLYLLRSVRSVFFGPLPEKYAAVTDLVGSRDRFPYILLAGSLLAIGFAPNLILVWAKPALAALLGSP